MHTIFPDRAVVIVIPVRMPTGRRKTLISYIIIHFLPPFDYSFNHNIFMLHTKHTPYMIIEPQVCALTP